MMKLTILGSGTAIIRKKRSAPSYMLEAGRQLLLFDCGWGAADKMLRAGFDPQNIDHIFITHPHADHMGNVLPIIESMIVSGIHFPETVRKKTLYLHGYRGFANDYKTLRGIMLPEKGIEQFAIEILEYKNTARDFGLFHAVSKEVRHRPDLFRSVAYRLESGGKTFMYSGDSSFDMALAACAKDADLALLEISAHPESAHAEALQRSHMTPYEAGIIAMEARVKKLVLVHAFGEPDARRIKKEVGKNYHGEAVIARDLMRIKA